MKRSTGRRKPVATASAARNSDPGSQFDRERRADPTAANCDPGSEFRLVRLHRLVLRQLLGRRRGLVQVRAGAGADRLALLRRHGPGAAGGALGADALLLGLALRGL